MESALKESVAAFEAKKQECLNFIAALSEVESSFEQDFPNSGDSQRLSLASLKAAAKKISDANFKILIAGQFKTGKSTLINAILGQEVLPAYSTPCTAVITELEYGPKPAAELYFKKEINLAALPAGLPEEIINHLRLAGNPAPPLRLDLLDKDDLEKYLTISDEDMEQAQGVADSPVSLCKLYWPLDFCHGNAVIIDSPGLNENGARDKTTMDYVPNADIILHVLTAQQIYGLPDQQFINSVKLLGSAPLLFIVNRIDLVTPQKERDRAMAYAHKKLLPHSVYGEEGIFFTSAAAALQGRLQNDMEQIKDSGIPAFEERIAKIFATERSRIKLSHVLNVFQDLDFRLGDYIPRLNRALSTDAGKLERQAQDQAVLLQRLERRIQRIKDICRNEISHFQEKFQSAVERFLQDYVHLSLPELIELADIADFNVINDKGKKEATALMVARVDEDIKFQLMQWVKNQGQLIYQQAFNRIHEELAEELKDFDLLVATLEEDLHLDAPESSTAKVAIFKSGNSLDMVGKLAAGGGIAGMAAIALLPARILGGFGPLGWVVAGLTTALGAALSYWSKTASRKSLKAAFLRESRQSITANGPEWAKEMSMEAANNIGSQLLLLIGELQKRVDDARRPVLTALQVLQKDQSEIKQKKEKLKEYENQFKKLQTKGAELLAAFELK